MEQRIRTNGPAALLATAVLIGLAVGALTQIGQSVLPDGVRQVANSISPWVTVAFLVGALAPSPRWAAAGGFIALVGALVGYYALIFVRFGYTGGGSSLLLWTIGSVLGGLVFGPAGWFWRWTAGNARIAAIALLAAVFVAEGAYLILILPEPAVGLGFIVAGLAVPLTLGRSWHERGWAWLGMLPALGLGVIGYVGLTWLNSFLV